MAVLRISIRGAASLKIKVRREFNMPSKITAIKLDAFGFPEALSGMSRLKLAAFARACLTATYNGEDWYYVRYVDAPVRFRMEDLILRREDLSKKYRLLRKTSQVPEIWNIAPVEQAEN